jgi:HK97 family phage prohead protease
MGDLMVKKRERRFSGICELRAAASEGEGKKIAGHAAVFNSLSEEIWGFREKIAPGAFAGALGKSDIRALLNHDPNYVLGRTSNGTVRAWEDDDGLAVEIVPPSTRWADDLLVSIGRGDISQMSFAFRVAEDKWETVDGVDQRTILSFDEIFDVSPVTYPAYPETDVSLRASCGMEPDDLAVIREHTRILRALIDSPEQNHKPSLTQLKRRLRALELETSI